MAKGYKDVKPIDVHQRPFKSYKRYQMTSVGAGFVTQSATHGNFRIDILDSSKGDPISPSITYPINSDGTNMHIAWRALQHRYYNDTTYNFKDPFNTRTFLSEHFGNSKTERTLNVSASTLALPYNDVGESIKPNSITFVTGIGDISTTITDDGEGNLRDNLILTSSFASSSRNFFYLSFNNEFRQSELSLTNNLSQKITYKLNDNIQLASGSNLQLVKGIKTKGDYQHESGFAVRFAPTDFIEIPHSEEFNKFNRLDDWTISFWFNVRTSGHKIETVLSKGGVKNLEITQNNNDLILAQNNLVGFTGKPRFYSLPNNSVTESMTQHRTPFAIGLQIGGASAESASLHFQSSDGTNRLHISSSLSNAIGLGWHHFVVRNSGSNCQIFVNGASSGTTGSLPAQPTSNDAQVRIGQYSGSNDVGINNNELAELRMYDYGVEDSAISSLANNHYISASCYQSNIVGNAFYKNGQLVISSPLPKYNTGSGAFQEFISLTYRGTHTIYENQVMVRIPKGEFNTSTNPTSTFTPVEGKTLTESEQNTRPPGDHTKTMFDNEYIFPYITSVGLYNDNNELLAIGKLAQPIQKRNDIDTNIIVRWDY